MTIRPARTRRRTGTGESAPIMLLRNGAIDMGPTGFDRAYGYGRIDVLNTLALVGPQCSVPADCEDSDPCTIDDCVGGACINTPMDCNDDDACTTDSCSGGGCSYYPITCNDSDPCTTVSCDAAAGCVYSPITCREGEVCVDGGCVTQACNNNGTCEPGEDCVNCPNDCRQKTTPAMKNSYCCDGDLPDCGNVKCSENGWICGGGDSSCQVHADCDDDQWCNGSETCLNGSCQSGDDPCPGQGCDETNDVCVEACGGNKAPCSVDGDCCSNTCVNGSCRGN